MAIGWGLTQAASLLLPDACWPHRCSCAVTTYGDLFREVFDVIGLVIR
jgi:hypothetical protein